MLLVVDANVLNDFARSEPTVLALVVSHVGPVHVLRDVLEEVDQLTEADCDRLVLIVARDAGWTCVTNDGRLRRECEQVDVPTRWGLQLLIDVVVAGGMCAAEAASIVATISENNPWISASVMAGFHKKLLEKPSIDTR